MSYKDFHKDRWNALAREFGDTRPLRAVISADSDQVNYYFDKTTKKILGRYLQLEHKTVLDLGCGIGRLSLWMARKAAQVTGVDISEEMARVAQNAARSQRLRNVTFQIYNGTTLPYEDASFDVILCVAVLKYVTDEEDFSKLIGEVCRTVVRGGQVAVIDQFDCLGPVNLSGSEDIGGMSVLRRPADYISLFQKNGMELVEQCFLYRARFQKFGRSVLRRLPLGHFFAAQPFVTRAMAAVDVRLDEVLRHRVRPVRGFELLSFVRRQ